MGLGKRDHRSGLEGDDGHVHVVTHVLRVDEPRCRPFALGVRHRCRGDVFFVGDEGLGRVETLHSLVGLPDPVKPDGLSAFVLDAKGACRRDIGVSALPHHVRLAAKPDGQFALDDEEHALGASVRL